MSMSDPIADMLTRIRNAHAVNKAKVNIPATNLKSAIASVMQDEGYIKSFTIDVLSINIIGSFKTPFTSRKFCSFLI